RDFHVTGVQTVLFRSQRRTAATMRSEQLWRDLRAKGDWDTFLPALEGVVALVREEAQLRAEATGLAPYDALMDQYDPGNRVADRSEERRVGKASGDEG